MFRTEFAKLMQPFFILGLIESQPLKFHCASVSEGSRVESFKSKLSSSSKSKALQVGSTMSEGAPYVGAMPMVSKN